MGPVTTVGELYRPRCGVDDGTRCHAYHEDQAITGERITASNTRRLQEEDGRIVRRLAVAPRARVLRSIDEAVIGCRDEQLGA